MKFQIKNEKYMLALLGLLVWACSSNNIDIENMRCEYQISPIGIDSPAPRFTWNYTTNNEDATEFSQDSYQLYIATREQDLRNSSDNSWQSDTIYSDTPHATYQGSEKLKSRTRYYWQVIAWDRTKEHKIISPISSFETAQLNQSDWTGVWITDNHDIDYFMQCLPYLDKTVHLVIFNDEKNFDERKKVVKMLRKEAQFYEINPLNYYKVSDTARQAVKKRNCTIDDDALELLLSRKGTNLMDIASEVEKLCLYTQHIDIHCVEELVSRPLDENVFDLTTAILSKDKQKMMSIYKDLMTINEEPVKLIVLVANSMRLIYQVKLLDRKGYTDQEIAKMLAVNPFRLKYVRKEGQFFQIDELLRCLNELSLLDVKIKTGQIDKKLGLELFMLRI